MLNCHKRGNPDYGSGIADKIASRQLADAVGRRCVFSTV